jgi:hypothetical protein
MRIDPAIAALRRDSAQQRRAQAAMAEAVEVWRAQPEQGAVLGDLERYGTGAPLETCPALRHLFADGREAQVFAITLVRALCAALAVEPFGHPPFRHGFGHGTSTLLLAHRGRAQLALHGCEPAAHAFETVTFIDGERHEAVLAGQARGRIVRVRGHRGFAEERVILATGSRLALDLREQALQVLAIDRRMVSLRLNRVARRPAPSREYDLASGALLKQAAGDIRVSRQEAMLALLGGMLRTEAVPTMTAIACEPGDTSLRWQALRECLALNTEAGFAALSEIACRADDPLGSAARALRGQLVEAHPELARLADARCPA